MNREIDNNIRIPSGMQPSTMGHVPLSSVADLKKNQTNRNNINTKTINHEEKR
jgi:hypothetical protein